MQRDGGGYREGTEETGGAVLLYCGGTGESDGGWQGAGKEEGDGIRGGAGGVEGQDDGVVGGFVRRGGVRWFDECIAMALWSG